MGLIADMSYEIEKIEEAIIDVATTIKIDMEYINESYYPMEKEEVKEMSIEYLGEISTDVKKIEDYLYNLKKSIEKIENLL